MDVKGSAYEKHRKAINILCPDYDRYTNVPTDDMVHIRYKFWASYYGVVKNLQAVQDLCDDPDVVVTVDCAELEEGRILIYETLKKLDNIIQHVKDRE
jgi:hypothetical protein